MQRNLVLLGAAMIAGVGMLARAADATPYAYASNQITHLTIQQYDPSTDTYSTLSPTAASTNIRDSAVFTPYGGTNYVMPGTAGQASSLTQAYSGPGPAPAEDTWGQAPAFTGARSDAGIGAGSVLSGGVSVNNVAEAYGPTTAGTATSGNAATVNFTITITTAGLSIRLNFQDMYSLMVTSSTPGDVATAAISNAFSITSADGTTSLFSYAPDGEINQQLSSQNGVPPNNSSSGTFNGVATSGPLAPGTYNISLTSGATVNIQGNQPVPEPGTLALLGSGLLGLGMLRRRRALRG